MSGRRDESLLLDDMIQAAERLTQLAPALVDGGEPDRPLAEQILWNLTQLGEAAKRLPESVRSARPDVAWSEMAQLRDVVVHHYEGVDWRVIRRIATEYLPAELPLLIEIRDELRREYDGSAD